MEGHLADVTMEGNRATAPHGNHRGLGGRGRLEGGRRYSSRLAWASAGQEHPLLMKQ